MVTATTPPIKLPLRHKIGSTVTPGDRLGLVSSRNKVTLIAGTGTYIRQGHLYASIVGALCATHFHDAGDGDGASAAANADGDTDGGEKYIISIQREGSSSSTQSNINISSCGKNKTTSSSSISCPNVGMLVLGRISRVVRPSHAMVDIVAIIPNGDDNKQQQKQQIIPLQEPFSGTLRQNEIRPNSSLEIRIEECIRPGDIILCRVHANGERDFIVTTAEAELGVIQAVCESSGCEMEAISWKEMQCPVTNVREGRKVAKPRQQR